MFSVRDFVKQGFLKAVGKQAAYQIIQNALGWMEKGVLEVGDLEEIQAALVKAGQMSAVEESFGNLESTLISAGQMSAENHGA